MNYFKDKLKNYRKNNLDNQKRHNTPQISIKVMMPFFIQSKNSYIFTVSSINPANINDSIITNKFFDNKLSK